MEKGKNTFKNLSLSYANTGKLKNQKKQTEFSNFIREIKFVALSSVNFILW